MPRTNYRQIPELTEKQTERFWRLVQKKSNEECWHWLGSCDRDGYGTVGFTFIDDSGEKRSLTYRSHRVAYKLHNGTDIDGIGMHSCDNPPCVNPHHQNPGTDAQNQAFRKGNPDFSGENHGNSKVSNQDAIAMVAEWQAGAKGKDLAAKYGISIAAVSYIVRGKNHKLSTGATPIKRTGEQHHRSKLNWEKVRQIRARHATGESNASLAKAFEVSNALISLIVPMKIWIE